jgi:hypothetical protein
MTESTGSWVVNATTGGPTPTSPAVPAASPTLAASGRQSPQVNQQLPRGGDTPIAETVDTLESQLERLANHTEDVRVAALNADLKHARGEDDALDRRLDDLRESAEQLTSALERVEDEVADLGDAVASGEERPSGQPRSRGRPHVPGGRTPPDGADQRLPGRQLDSPAAEPSAGVVFGGDAGGGGTDQVADEDLERGETIAPTSTPVDADPAPVRPAVDPVEFLIPGSNLRDMWRVTARSGGNGGDGVSESTIERWVLETRPRSDRRDPDETPEFPPEVTEFTLDPDEIPFEQLLRLSDDG